MPAASSETGSAEVFVASMVSSPDQFVEPVENLLFQLQIFDGGLNHQIHVAQRNFGGRGENPVHAIARLARREDVALDAIAINFGDAAHAARHLFRVDVAQNDRQAARAQPLRDARAHHAGADDGGSQDRRRACL